MNVLHNVYSFGERSNMGSLQNRFEVTASNLRLGIQNTDVGHSTIMNRSWQINLIITPVRVIILGQSMTRQE